MKNIASNIFFFLIVTAILVGLVNSQMALLFGLLFTMIFTNPFTVYEHKIIPLFLKVALIGLGFGMFIKETLETSAASFSLTFLSITLTIGLGFLLTKLLNLDLKLGHLIASGTAICGGSAIAAISPIIKANAKTTSVAIGIVFLLNSVAIFIFPSIGHLLQLTQKEFGLWSAVAIHDTSSVIGAAMIYGDEAVKVATTVKLSRTLWIIPLSLLSIFFYKTKGVKIKIPFFIFLFMAAIVINNSHILPIEVTKILVLGAKKILIVTLFLIGASITVADLRSTGLKPILLASILWIFISVFSITYILLF